MTANKWKVLGALVLVAGIIYFIGWHWNRFLADFWGLDDSRVGPNLVASFVVWALILIATVFLYPPWRRAVARFATLHVQSIKDHITSEQTKLHAKLDRHEAKMNHIIKNTKAIPNEVPGVSDEHQP